MASRRKIALLEAAPAQGRWQERRERTAGAVTLLQMSIVFPRMHIYRVCK